MCYSIGKEFLLQGLTWNIKMILFKFPETLKKETRVCDILVKNPDPKYTLPITFGIICRTTQRSIKKKETDLVLGL